jgi:hypothetical protein
MTDPDDSRPVERAAAAEVNARRVNEAIERGAQGAGTAVFVCECGNLGCSETVELTIAEYEAVRSGFERFLILPGHAIEEIEDVASGTVPTWWWRSATNGRWRWPTPPTTETTNDRRADPR